MLDGKQEEALRLLDDDIAAVGKAGRLWCAAELHRQRGQLLLKGTKPNLAQAEAQFQQAIEIARSQSAKFWELRAATSLARLWRDQGKNAEARDLLAPVYGWFSEGFDLPDLKEAKALLEELSG
jgi:predicted ATPase